jgi:hypothetical protein
MLFQKYWDITTWNKTINNGEVVLSIPYNDSNTVDLFNNLINYSFILATDNLALSGYDNAIRLRLYNSNLNGVTGSIDLIFYSEELNNLPVTLNNYKYLFLDLSSIKNYQSFMDNYVLIKKNEYNLKRIITVNTTKITIITNTTRYNFPVMNGLYNIKRDSINVLTLEAINIKTVYQNFTGLAINIPQNTEQIFDVTSIGINDFITDLNIIVEFNRGSTNPFFNIDYQIEYSIDNGTTWNVFQSYVGGSGWYYGYAGNTAIKHIFKLPVYVYPPLPTIYLPSTGVNPLKWRIKFKQLSETNGNDYIRSIYIKKQAFNCYLNITNLT